MRLTNCRSLFQTLICLVILGTMLPGQSSFGEESVSTKKRTIVTLNGVNMRRDVRENHLGDRYVEIECLLKLEPGDEFHFTTISKYSPFIYVTTPGRPRRLVGVKVNELSDRGDETWKNPLQSLTQEEVHGLWGLSLDHWSDEIAGQLEHLDFDRVCLTIHDGVLGSYEFREQSPRGLPLPALPEQITDLVIEPLDLVNGLKNLDGLRRLPKLRSLTASDVPFDCNWLVNSTELRSLWLDSCRPLKNTDALASLGELRELSMSYCDGFIDVQFVKSLSKLRLLNLIQTEVADLGPIAGLSDLESLGLGMSRIVDLSPLNGLPRLTQVGASGSLVTRLPGLVPHLRSLNAIASKVTDVEAALFRIQNPRCKLFYRWNQSLSTLLKEATELQVHFRDNSRVHEPADDILFQSQDATEVMQMIEGIQLVETELCIGCGCFTHHYLDFRDGDRLIASISLNHCQHLRHRIWPGDAFLTPESSQFLANWLAERGVKGPLKDWEDSQRSRRSFENKK